MREARRVSGCVEPLRGHLRPSTAFRRAGGAGLDRGGRHRTTGRHGEGVGCSSISGDGSLAGRRRALRCPHLARATGTSIGQATDGLETAGRLEKLPETAAAARAGALSATQAAAVTDAALLDPRPRRAWWPWRSGPPWPSCGRTVPGTRAAAEPDPEARRKATHAGRYLRSWSDAEGAWHLPEGAEQPRDRRRGHGRHRRREGSAVPGRPGRATPGGIGGLRGRRSGGTGPRQIVPAATDQVQGDPFGWIWPISGDDRR